MVSSHDCVLIVVGLKHMVVNSIALQAILGAVECILSRRSSKMSILFPFADVCVP